MNTANTLQEKHTQNTSMLDFNHPNIQKLIDTKLWRELSEFEAIKQIYNFVKDQIKFGYNADDKLKASQVLADGYGQCNTKGTLLIALLRAVNIPTRIHGFTIDNSLQKGAIPFYLFHFAPQRILHSWVEVHYQNRWVNLEGYIIDQQYLSQVQNKFSHISNSFSGYGIATKNLQKPQINWHGNSTYIQKEGIAEDFGIYDQPDDLYRHKGSNLRGFKKTLFRYIFRHLMNNNIKRIRSTGIK